MTHSVPPGAGCRSRATRLSASPCSTDRLACTSFTGERPLPGAHEWTAGRPSCMPESDDLVQKATLRHDSVTKHGLSASHATGVWASPLSSFLTRCFPEESSMRRLG